MILRIFFQAALLLLSSCSLVVAQQASSAQDAASPYDSVDPRIGTAGGGNTFPGASLPFGMIQWSPDTNQNAWYYSTENRIWGFGLTHISGAGCPLYGDFAILPYTGEVTTSPGKDFAPFAAAFDHAREEAHPGSYVVTLASGVRIEVTVTDRAGIARFTFPAGTPARLLVNSGSSANIRDDDRNGIALTGPTSYEAVSKAGHFCGSDSHYTIFGVGQFDKPYKKAILWQDDALQSDLKSTSGKHTGAWLDFGNERVIELKIAVSFINAEGARKNLVHDLPGWNFDAVRTQARETWSKLLNRFAVEGGTAEQRTKFYTAVYHSFLSPNLFSDVDGQYIGFDKVLHRVAGQQKAQYANFSDWDIYRNTVQLQALFEPERESDMLQSLVNDAEQGGQLPRWEAANDVTYVMGGDSPVPVIASAYAFGAHNFDGKTALKYIVKAASDTQNNHERPYLADYLKLGYVPSEKDDISASRTLEYASDDFAAAQFAKALGDKEAEQRFLKLSQSWKNLLDPGTKWIRPRNSGGSWLAGFDPEGSEPKRHNAPVSSDQLGFEEGNTYQYSFMVPFDYPALFEAMGGEANVIPRLDKFFTKLRCWGEPCFNIENEPDFVTPYTYVFAGQPWKTQKVVIRIARESFKTTPDGIPGNDDLGATSGVYLWNALGMYPAIPGVSGLVLGTPMFDKATLQLAGGRTLTIARKGSGIYVHSISLNGRALRTDWFPVSDLHAGQNTLEFTTQLEPDTKRGTVPGDRPPSFR